MFFTPSTAKQLDQQIQEAESRLIQSRIHADHQQAIFEATTKTLEWLKQQKSGHASSNVEPQHFPPVSLHTMTVPPGAVVS